jgi:GNAT superfamily N-acetyltransferase
MRSGEEPSRPDAAPARSTLGEIAKVGDRVGVFFDADYREPAVLRDGSEVVLRLIRPDDKELLLRGFRTLSHESRYRRFFSAKNDLSPEELRYLTEVDGVHHFAMGALSPDGRDGLGVARFIQLDGEPGLAEAAIAVADHVQGRGLGSLLFQRLVAAAIERGVTRFRCDMLGTNAGMAELVRSFATDSSVQVSSGVVRMEFGLPALGPEHPAAEPPRETGLYRLFGLVAKGALELRTRWQRLGARLRWGGADEPAPDDELDAPRPAIGVTAAGEVDDTDE